MTNVSSYLQYGSLICGVRMGGCWTDSADYPRYFAPKTNSLTIDSFCTGRKQGSSRYNLFNRRDLFKLAPKLKWSLTNFDPTGK